ncbi:type 1 glutamine amidotransferase [Amycolatopsis xylanica]|uniref:type 1 glutamine amidotransferase n=1 Tax=Amycolatopsis xylanica TaxID=589385 RepID=UPI001FE12F74|nr:type 1 glutamine amidotransferase [Amycolatopsis xylanica]
MSTPKLLIIQPDLSDPAGPLGTWLREAGAELDVRLPPRHEIPESLDGYDGVVCLGGGMGAQDDEKHPWLAQVRRLLAAAAGASMPTLGICLGAQLLTVATGGRVVKGDAGPEIGPGLVAKKDVAWMDPLFADLPMVQDVVQFHTDAIEQLPPGAELLGSAPRYQHQAFRLNRRVYGIQFHIETTPAVLKAWADAEPDLAAYARPGVFETEALTRLHEDIAETWRPFAERFVRLADGELEPAQDKSRMLPLA